MAGVESRERDWKREAERVERTWWKRPTGEGAKGV
jgi:hypothetical protein